MNIESYLFKTLDFFSPDFAKKQTKNKLKHLNWAVIIFTDFRWTLIQHISEKNQFTLVLAFNFDEKHERFI